MKIRVKYLGMVAEWAGAKTKTLDLTGTTIADLNNQLLETIPELRNITFQIAVNQSVASMETELNENDEVAVLPPFAGG
jgi:sulfur-carrier protein